MKAMNLMKAYGRQGLTLDLARLVEPADLAGLRKIEKEFADVILADETAFWSQCDGEIPVQKVRLANVGRTSNYLDIYLTRMQKRTAPRGIVITYPNGDGYGPKWHGKQWKSAKRVTFEGAIEDARRKVEKNVEYGWEVEPTTYAILEVGEKWENALSALVKAMLRRATEIARQLPEVEVGIAAG